MRERETTMKNSIRHQRYLSVAATTIASLGVIVSCASDVGKTNDEPTAVSEAPVVTSTPAVHGFNPSAPQLNNQHPNWYCQDDDDCSTYPTCGTGPNKCVNGLCSYVPLGNSAGYSCPCFAGQEDFCSNNGALGISKCQVSSLTSSTVIGCTSGGTGGTVP